MKRPGRWRALVLVSVHLVILAHVAHYLSAGRTLSPVEPSESMYALELGHVNAGLIFFALAILSTLAFGRFFCGWGCHLVALQDLCGELLRRIGLKPKPLRSRLMLLMPAALAFYMFAWPTVRRLAFGDGQPFPGFTNHLVTDDFWRTFPGPVFTVLTFLACGFAAVWILGSKGFCTYACPYGAVFSAADKLSPFRIVVDDGCQQTGQCTARCTSNVIVHEQVRLHRMVVDSGCMKCMDCVSACPNDALSLGFTTPALFAPKPAEAPSRWSPLSWGEEALVVTTCVLATLALRGLYDGPPLLLAAGLGAISAHLALLLWQLARRPTVRLQSLTLKAGREVSTSGRVLFVVGLAWMAFLAHSAFVQWHRFAGTRALSKVTAPRDEVLSGTFDASAASPEVRRALTKAIGSLGLADRFGLARVTEIDLGLAYAELAAGRDADAIGHLRAAAARESENAGLQEDLVIVLASRGRLDEAVVAQRELIRRSAGAEALGAAHYRLGELLLAQGRLEEGGEAFAEAVAAAPSNVPSLHALGGTLRRIGRPVEALAPLREAARLAPGDPDVARELELAIREASAGGGEASAGGGMGP